MKRTIISILIALLLIGGAAVAEKLTFKPVQVQTLLNSVNTAKATSAGAGDAGKIVKLNGSGKVDATMANAASDTAAGVIELATDAETLTGTATDRALTPANLTAKMAAPGDIGGTTPYEGRFTTVSGSKVRVVKTGDAVLTAAECRGTYVCNQGATGEADITLYALEETATVVFSNEEAFIIEVNPPSGERFLFDGTWLDADDCIDMDATEGSDIVCVRKKAQSGVTWYYKCDSITGTHTDTGASD